MSTVPEPVLPLLLSPNDFAQGTGGKVCGTDPRLRPLLSGASAALRRYCGWHIAPVVSEDLVLDAAGGDVLTLPTMRLLEVESLRVLGHDVDVSELEWSITGEVRRRWWPDRWRGVQARIRHGFDQAPDVVQIVQQVVANAVASPLGATREQAGQLSVSWATTAPGVSGGISLLERDYAVLDAYRIGNRP